MSLLSYLRETRKTRALKNVRDAYDAAARENARLDGEMCRLQMLHAHYQSLIITTDHTKDWHRYADLQDCRAAVHGEILRVAAQQAVAQNELARHTETYMEKHHG